jgi:hypothetical protein
MYSAQGEYKEKINPSELTHSMYNKFPAIKKHIDTIPCKYNNMPYYPKQYLENIDKVLLCQHFKGTDKYHPACEAIAQNMKPISR